MAHISSYNFLFDVYKKKCGKMTKIAKTTDLIKLKLDPIRWKLSLKEDLLRTAPAVR